MLKWNNHSEDVQERLQIEGKKMLQNRLDKETVWYRSSISTMDSMFVSPKIHVLDP